MVEKIGDKTMTVKVPMIGFSIDEYHSNLYYASLKAHMIFFDLFDNEYKVIDIERFGVHNEVVLYDIYHDVETSQVLGGHEMLYVDYAEMERAGALNDF